jgi:hypothetical protein
MNIKNISSLILLIILSSCSLNKGYQRANNAYLNQNYELAIELYDKMLSTTKNSAQQTKAELERSDCYYQIGYREYKKGNWSLAAEYLYLANSAIADAVLDFCYQKLAEQSIAQGDKITALEYLSYIIDYLPDSDIYRDVLVQRSRLYAEMKDYKKSFQDYQTLFALAPLSTQLKSLQPIIDDFVPFLLTEAEQFKKEGNFQKALDSYYYFRQYPLQLQSSITNEICELYLIIANLKIEQKSYRTAKTNLDNAQSICNDKKTVIDQIIENTCSQIFTEGDSLLAKMQFESAIKKYETCFVFRQNDSAAHARISSAQQKKENYHLAKEWESKGTREEEEKDFTAALASYKYSAGIFQLPDINEKISRMENTIEAERDPQAFAIKIIREYKSGALLRNLDALKAEMRLKYGQYAKFSEWKVTYAIGKYRYEVRYDIISPEETFYFAWRVNLITKEVSPSNRISDNILSTSLLMKHQKQE